MRIDKATCLTDEQKVFIEANRLKLTIGELSARTGRKRATIHNYLVRNNLDFKRCYGFKKRENVSPEGCFNPNERENWLL